MEEGNTDYLFEKVPFYDGGEATVWEHINKSIDYTQKRKDLKDKISNAEDILTTPNNNLTEEQISE